VKKNGVNMVQLFYSDMEKGGNNTFIVTKQLMDNLVISADEGDMRQMMGFV
jgi:hypothetical protein